MSAHNLLAATACLLLVPALHAAAIIVDDIGGDVMLRAGRITGMPIPGSSTLEESALGSIHQTLQSDGIQTDGRVTFLLADTDAGLTFFTLIDAPSLQGPTPLGGGSDSTLGLSTTAPTTTEAFVNAGPDDFTSLVDLNNGFQVFDGIFGWDSILEGDGFAWGGLDEGDTVSFHFFDLGANPGLGNAPFQFLTFTGGHWGVAATDGFSVNNQFAFSFTTSNIPAPGALALMAIAGITRRRRR